MADDKILEWHRPLERRALARPLTIGAVLMTIGGLLVLLSLPRATAIPYLAIAGGACIVSAPVSVLFSLLGGSRIEKCLIVRRDAFVMQRGDDETMVRWEEIDAVKFENGAIEVVRKDGSTIRLEEAFTKPDAIAARMEEVRRKSGFGLV